jgi:hypothetical protein
MQKPGNDYYSVIVSIQVLICFYLIILYPKMEGRNQSILDQVNQNSFSGSMVVVLTIQIILMIVERFIYKSKKFIEK